MKKKLMGGVTCIYLFNKNKSSEKNFNQTIALRFLKLFITLTPSPFKLTKGTTFFACDLSVFLPSRMGFLAWIYRIQTHSNGLLSFTDRRTVN